MKKTTILKTIKGDVIVAAADDMSKVMDLDPAIDTKLKKAALLDAIIQDAEVAEVSDDFQDATWDLLEKLECKAAIQRKEEPEVADEAVEAKKDAKKDKPKKASKKVTRSVATGQAILEKPADKDTLIKTANDIYVDNGGADNEKEAKWNVNTILPAFLAAELIVVDPDGGFTYPCSK